MTQAAVADLAPTTATQVLDSNTSPTASAPPSAPPAPAPVEEKISPKFQALLRRERVAVDRERAAKAKETEAEAKAKSFADREAKLTEFENIKKTNPLKALELLGLSYQELTSVALADGNIPPELEVKRVEEKFDSYLRGQQELERRKLEDEQRAAEEKEKQIVTEFKTEISTYIKENSDRYELISFEQSEELVYDVIDGHYERTKNPETGVGEVLTIAQAADKVEEHLEKKYDKARELKKMKAFLAPRPGPSQADKQQTKPSQTPKTLNNQLSATPSPTTRILTDDERVRRAIAYAKGIRP